MSFIALHAIDVGALLDWRNGHVGSILNAFNISQSQRGTCILTACALLPNGFVGLLLWIVAVLASGFAILLVHKHPRRSTQRML